MSKLFQPLRVGNVQLQHRIVMAPLTRLRAGDDHVPPSMSVDYYTQRASVPGTFIIAEATLISPAHGGLPNGPGLWTEDQINGWKKITDAVHEKGCGIFCQLVALGRAADPGTLEREGGYPVVSSSAVPMAEGSTVPKELSEEEIQSTITDFAAAAQNAIKAGFDGVEVHGANGYLVDQFTQDNCNKRTDRWGGSIENRARFGVEVTKAIVNAIGSDRVGYRISPFSEFQAMRMAEPRPQFSYLVDELRKLKLAYLHVIESRVHNIVDVEKTEGIEFALDIWGNTSPVFVAGGFSPETAHRAVDEEYQQNEVAVVFGRHFIANPDLPFRIQNGLPLTKYDRSSFYTPKQVAGYVDYPFSPEFGK